VGPSLFTSLTAAARRRWRTGAAPAKRTSTLCAVGTGGRSVMPTSMRRTCSTGSGARADWVWPRHKHSPSGRPEAGLEAGAQVGALLGGALGGALSLGPTAGPAAALSLLAWLWLRWSPVAMIRQPSPPGQ
jgi:hypothetical protein